MPDALAAGGILIEPAGRSGVGIWIMPNNVQDGLVKGFIRTL